MADSCIDTYHDDLPEVHTTQVRAARKPHACYECGETIRPGAKYEYVRGLWDGRWYTFRTCTRCLMVRRKFFVSWIYGMMVEDFEAAHGVDYRDGIPDHIQPCRSGLEPPTTADGGE